MGFVSRAVRWLPEPLFFTPQDHGGASHVSEMNEICDLRIFLFVA
ncbi:hypothetical protein U9M48_034797 [Paspalum notatum var. saurae]|uniref:Uncharacterized protein n=1 Tax=Paspalum notatum var. saurae TaxID=547442 RepID=A0AAQ3X9B2_PASNO